MTILATAKVRTITARLVSRFGSEYIEVAGANKHLLCEQPDTGSRLDMQKEWRAEVRKALIAAGAEDDAVYMASWEIA